jgi:hypothetical protein
MKAEGLNVKLPQIQRGGGGWQYEKRLKHRGTEDTEKKDDKSGSR